ncbi:MAG TPA: TetR/AcrR family transcriptional regulator [Burkholderiales bacterium]|nr:TetR/AcrR family transcriptional regulator [Burkholderiales bacterium]
MAAVPNRERVLRAATAAFMTDGYRSSIDRIAQRAGVAKQTVYSHFPSKDHLFEEVAREMAKRVLVELEGESSDLRGALLRFALAYRERVLSDEGIAVFRTLVAEIPRFRTLARAIYQGGPGETAARLAEYLEKAMAAGRLRRDDPLFAAELFMSMLVGLDRIKRLYGVARFEADARRAARIVDRFLAAYTP